MTWKPGILRATDHRLSEDRPLIACDTETTGVDVWHGDEPFTICFVQQDGTRTGFEWPVDGWTRTVMPVEEELEEVRLILEDPDTDKVFHNAKFDVRILWNAFGIKTRGVIHDTMFMSHIANSQEPHGLKILAEKYLRWSSKDQDDLRKRVKQLRRKAEKLGWEIGRDWNRDIEGNWQSKAVVDADYWLPKAMGDEDDLCLEYCFQDCERTMLLFDMYKNEAFPLLSSECGHSMWDVYVKELELWGSTWDMETRGVKIDPDQVQVEIKEWRKNALQRVASIKKASGRSDFNVNSSQQLADLLYNRLGIPCLKRTPKGAPATSMDALIPHEGHPVVDDLFTYKAAKQGLQHFFYKYDTLPDLDGTLHTDFNQVGPSTGRFSCRRPNLQNVANALSSRSPSPLQARRPFVVREGFEWHCYDYSQLELRIFADVAQEQVMLKALAEGKDLHSASANKAWGGKGNPAAIRAARHALEFDHAAGSGGVDNEEVIKVWNHSGVRLGSRPPLSKQQEVCEKWLEEFDYDIEKAEESLFKKTTRAKAKMIMFARIFGGGPNAVKDLLFVTYEEAVQFMNEWAIAFPRIEEYIKSYSRQAEIDGYIMTCFGRRLEVDPDYSYRAVNYNVQGSAADALKRAMRRINRQLRQPAWKKYDTHMIMTVHDELILETPVKWANHHPLQDRIQFLMEDHGGAFGVETPTGIERVRHRWSDKEKFYSNAA